MRESRGSTLAILAPKTRDNRKFLCVSRLALIVLLAGGGFAVGSNTSDIGNSQSQFSAGAPAKPTQSAMLRVVSGASGKGSSQQVPVFSNVAISPVTSYGATISWNTNIASDGLVGWGPTALFGQDSGVLDSYGATSHSYTISGLYPGTTYQFFIRSRPVNEGVVDVLQQDWAVWNADGCSGTCSFTTAAPPAGTFNYALYVTGPHNVIQGYDTYVAAWLVPMQGNYKFNTLAINLSGLPPHTSIQWTEKQQWGIGADSPSNNSLLLYDVSVGVNGYDMRLSTNQGGATPDGGTACTSAGGVIVNTGCRYTVTITGSGPGLPAKSVHWTLNVNAPRFVSGTPSSYPAIPCLASGSVMIDGSPCSHNWTDTMNIYGQFWCPEDTDFSQTGMCSTYQAPIPVNPARCIRANDSSHLVPVGGNQTQAWYYDGDLVYEQIGHYLGNTSKWSRCVNNVNQVYRDGYVIGSNGHIPGYMIFTEGLYSDYLQNRTATDLQAIDDLVNNAAYAATFHADFSQTITQREAAYRLQADLWGSLLDNPVRYAHPASYWLQYDVAHVIGQIEQQCIQKQPYEYFMTGLQAEALIKYYIATGSTDIRVPPAIKQLADCVWNSGWAKTADDPYAFPYSSPGPIYGFSMTGAYGGGSFENLNLLIAPMYAWMYSITGDPTYQVEGDMIWQYGVTMPTSGGVRATVGWTGNGGKQFSQNYRWSFNYVTWRSAPVASPRILSLTGTHL